MHNNRTPQPQGDGRVEVILVVTVPCCIVPPLAEDYLSALHPGKRNLHEFQWQSKMLE